MEYLTIFGVFVLVTVIIGFYLFYCRLNDNNHRVEELKRTVKLLDQNRADNSNASNSNSQNIQSPSNLPSNFPSNLPSNLPMNHPNVPNSKPTSNSGYQDPVPQSDSKANNSSSHGNIVGESRVPVSICATSEPSEESNNCTNYAPIPDEVENVQALQTMDNMSEFPQSL